MIVGSVGSGKTSLLAALLGEMYKITGDITWNRFNMILIFLGGRGLVSFKLSY